MNQSQIQIDIYKKKGIQAIKSITKSSMSEIRALSFPPETILIVLQCVQTILAGNYEDIDLNPASNQPKNKEWNSLKKMVREAYNFLNACTSIFDKLGKDPYLDDRVRQVSNILKNTGYNKYKILQYSTGCSLLYIWLQNVINYWMQLQKMQ